jgi:hypothetical protein
VSSEESCALGLARESELCRSAITSSLPCGALSKCHRGDRRKVLSLPSFRLRVFVDLGSGYALYEKD